MNNQWETAKTKLQKGKLVSHLEPKYLAGLSQSACLEAEGVWRSCSYEHSAGRGWPHTRNYHYPTEDSGQDSLQECSAEEEEHSEDSYHPVCRSSALSHCCCRRMGQG